MFTTCSTTFLYIVFTLPYHNLSKHGVQMSWFPATMGDSGNKGLLQYCKVNHHPGMRNIPQRLIVWSWHRKTQWAGNGRLENCEKKRDTMCLIYKADYKHFYQLQRPLILIDSHTYHLGLPRPNTLKAAFHFCHNIWESTSDEASNIFYSFISRQRIYNFWVKYWIKRKTHGDKFMFGW